MENGIGHLRFEFAVDPMIRYRMALFRPSPCPPPLLPRVILASKSRTCGSHLPSMCAVTARGEVGGGVGSGLAWLQAPLPHKGVPPVLTIFFVL